MNKKLLAILGLVVILVGVIGGGAFANSIDANPKENQQINTIRENSINKNQVPVKNDAIEIKNPVQICGNSNNTNYSKNSSNNPSKNTYQNMIKVMRDNGFKDASRYMQTGDYNAMLNYMNNLS